MAFFLISSKALGLFDLLFGRCSSELAQLVPLSFSRWRSTHYSDRLYDFLSPFLDVKDVFVNSFFLSTARVWNSLPIECFPLTYNLNGFNSRINIHLSVPKMKNNNYICHAPYLRNREQYNIWLWVLVHLCKMTISPGVFFIFLKFPVFGLLVGGKSPK